MIPPVHLLPDTIKPEGRPALRLQFHIPAAAFGRNAHCLLWQAIEDFFSPNE